MDLEKCPKYSEYIMCNVRQALGNKPDDTSKDEYINSLSHTEVLALYFQWEGIIGYEYKIKSAIEEIYGIELED